MLQTTCKGMALAALVLVGLTADVDPGRAAPPAAKILERPQSLTMVWWGSSSSGMLRRSMDRMLGERLKITYKEGGIWFRADWMSKDLEAGDTAKYGKMIERVQAYTRKAGKFDYGVLQLSGGILWSADSEKHVSQILDDMCDAIVKSGATPLIFEHWTSRDREKMRRYCVRAAHKHGAKVAFCGSASNEVISEKGKKYIGGGEGHTNSRGLYLWSCCMYAALTGQSPIGLPVPAGKTPVGISAPPGGDARKNAFEEGGGPEEVVEVTKQDAAYLQKKAWEAHQKYSRLLEQPAK